MRRQDTDGWGGGGGVEEERRLRSQDVDVAYEGRPTLDSSLRATRKDRERQTLDYRQDTSCLGSMSESSDRQEG